MRKVYTTLTMIVLCAVTAVQANVLTVTTTVDSGPGSLRDAIGNAGANDTITFSLSYPDTIVLTSGQIMISNNIVLWGPGSDLLKISGNSATRIFLASADVDFIGMTLQDGFLTGSGNYGAAVVTSSGQNLTFEDCVFTGNVQATSVGGAVTISGTASFTNCEFFDNQAQGGAAIQIADGGVLTILNCSFYNNNGGSGNGGAIRCNFSDASIMNTTFYNNQSNAGGGAINYNCGGCMGFGATKEMSIVNCTFSNNSATTGNEIQVQDFSGDIQIRLMNTIIHNTNGGNNFSSNSTSISDGGNICSDSTMMGFLTNSGDQVGVDPLLSAFGDNGGMTNTLMLSCNSPAYNAGIDTGAPAVDQRGMDRYGTTDIGAVEVQPRYGTDTRAACTSFQWIDGNTYTADTSTALFNLSGAASNGCDSLVTLNLTINQTSTSIDTRSACDEYTWIDSNTYTTNNNTAIYNIAGGAANGCDSLITLNLTINQASMGVDSRSACDEYTWIDGNTYTNTTNTATYNITGGAANGCDSLVTLDLTVNTINKDVTQNGTSLSSDEVAADYQWLNCDSGLASISGATSRSFTPQQSGNYAVAVTKNGCSDTSACRTVTLTATGITESSYGQVLSVYPNPTKGNLSIELSKVHPALTVTIRDVMGRQVHLYEYQKVQRTQVELNTAPGIYFIEVTNHKDLSEWFSIVRE